MVRTYEPKSTSPRLPVNSDGVVAPRPISYAEFLEWADEDTLAEWVEGEVEMSSPASYKHQDIGRFLIKIVDMFVEANDLGTVMQPPFQMKLKAGREPDLIFVANAHLDRLKSTFLDGPADLVVEIVSPESSKRDRQTKLGEYEAGHVPEYWLLDPLKHEALFYQLNAQHKYEMVSPDGAGRYFSRELSGFWLKVAWLWQEKMPVVTDVLLEIGGEAYLRYLLERVRKQGLQLPPA